MRICDCGCGREIKPSRGSPRRFYSTGCRMAYHREARRIGDRALRRRRVKSELIYLASMTPAERRLELGQTALKMGVIPVGESCYPGGPVGETLLDHIIVGDGRFFSFAERGLL